jgi:hypothetical protein
MYLMIKPTLGFALLCSLAACATYPRFSAENKDPGLFASDRRICMTRAEAYASEFQDMNEGADMSGAQAVGAALGNGIAFQKRRADAYAGCMGEKGYERKGK